jgi:LPS export ABC transporter protein LptC
MSISLRTLDTNVAMEDGPSQTASSWSGADWARRSRLPDILGILRWAFVVAAIAVLVWMASTRPPKLSDALPASTSGGITEMAMLSPALSGTLKDGRLYHLTAERATLPNGDDQLVHMQNVRVKIGLLNNSQVNIRADQGLFRRKTNQLELTGNVVVTRNDGYQLETEAAEIWRGSTGYAAKSTHPTRVTGPAGSALADGFVVAPGFDPIRLTGLVRLRLNGDFQ